MSLPANSPKPDRHWSGHDPWRVVCRQSSSRSFACAKPPYKPDSAISKPFACMCRQDLPRREPHICLRSEEHTSELQSHVNLVCRLLLEKKKSKKKQYKRIS